MADEPDDQFENLFEPFNLEGEPTDVQPRPYPTEESGVAATTTQQPAVGYVYCASCGNPNHPENQHCEQCGARPQRTQTPVAPQPMLRTTAGARALVVLSAIVLGVALLALVINLFGGDDATVADSST